MSKFRPRQVSLLVGLAFALAGCSTSFNREFRDDSSIKSTAEAVDVPSASVSRSEEGVLDLSADLGMSPSAFLVKSMTQTGGDLPATPNHIVSVTEAGVYDLLQMLIKGTGISLHVEGGARALERSGAVAVVGLSGDLRSILERLSKRMGFFWSVQDHVLSIEPTRQFVIDLPAALSDDSLAGITNTIQSLGAIDTYLDRISRTLSFRANAKQLGSIESYLHELRSTGSMIVYRLQIFEVDLYDKSSEGVAWNKLASSNFNRYKDLAGGTSNSSAGTTTQAPSTAATTAAAMLGTTLDGTVNASGGIGAMLVGRRFSLDFLVEFLKTQGTVRAVSQPRLTIMNRGRGSMRVGESRTIISKIGSSLANGISQVTTETTPLRTGLDLSITGELSGGTIITRTRVGLNNIVSLESTQAGGTTLQLARTADNEIETTVRMPPGYTAILGGISKDSLTSDRGVGITQNTKESNVVRSELVIVLTPSLVRFTPSKEGQPS